MASAWTIYRILSLHPSHESWLLLLQGTLFPVPVNWDENWIPFVGTSRESAAVSHSHWLLIMTWIHSRRKNSCLSVLISHSNGKVPDISGTRWPVNHRLVVRSKISTASDQWSSVIWLTNSSCAQNQKGNSYWKVMSWSGEVTGYPVKETICASFGWFTTKLRTSQR